MSDVDDLRALVRESDWLIGVLRTVRECGIPQAWVGAGTVRDLVWGRCFGDGFRPETVRDVDVAYFAPGDLSREQDERLTRQLARVRPDVPWEAKNQAAVHTWYVGRFGGDPVPPLTSIADAVATWPETATAVAVRLREDDHLDVCAPLGLGDLLGGVWRHNPRRVSVTFSLERLARHRPVERWPGVRVVVPTEPTAIEPTEPTGSARPARP